MHIRPINDSDIPELAVLYEQFWNQKSNPDSMMASLKRMQGNPNYIILNAFEEKILVGSILGVICNNLYGDCRPFLVVEDFLVDKSYQRKGIGKALFLEMENLARVKSCINILLVTDVERAGAQRFYESMGFEPNTFKGYKKKL